MLFFAYLFIIAIYLSIQIIFQFQSHFFILNTNYSIYTYINSVHFHILEIFLFLLNNMRLIFLFQNTANG